MVPVKHGEIIRAELTWQWLQEGVQTASQKLDFWAQGKWGNGKWNWKYATCKWIHFSELSSLLVLPLIDTLSSLRHFDDDFMRFSSLFARENSLFKRNGLAALSLLSYVSKACRPTLLSTARHFDFDFESHDVQSLYKCSMERRKQRLDQMYSFFFQVQHHVKIASKGTEMSQMRLDFMKLPVFFGSWGMWVK